MTQNVIVLAKGGRGKFPGLLIPSDCCSHAWGKVGQKFMVYDVAKVGRRNPAEMQTYKAVLWTKDGRKIALAH